MSDMFSIGANAIQIYRHSLSTVSNNIANLNTEGYSRQVTDVSEASPIQRGNVFLGTGANIEGVVRAYDEYTESSLRNSSSDLATQDPQVKYAERIIDLMGSENAGLSSALDQFFASAAELSTDAASLTQRGNFLRDSDVLAARFQEVASGMANIERDTREDINQQIGTMNSLSEQLALVNKQLARKSSADKQPAGLLDQRDAILRDMAEVTRVHVTTQKSGQVDIRLGNSGGTVLVQAVEATMLGANFDDSDPGRIDIIADPYGDAEVTSTIGNGALGGLMNFRSQTLTPAMDQFDFLAQTLVKEVNEIHEAGLDANGLRGKELFSIDPIFEVSAPTIAGDVDVEVNVVDPEAFKYSAFEMQYQEADRVWRIQDNASGAVTFSEPGRSVVEYSGMELSFDGKLSNGDTFFVTPQSRPASGIKMIVTDPMAVSASALMRVVPNNNNISDAAGSVSFGQELAFEGFQFGKNITGLINNQNAVSDINVLGNSLQPSYVIPRGVSDVTLKMDVPNDSNMRFQVMTSEGVHVLGHAIDEDTQAGMRSLDQGFMAGNEYNSNYLNEEGDEAYLDMNMTYGYLAESSSEVVYTSKADGTGLDAVNKSIPANVYSDRVTLTQNTSGSSIDIISNGALKLNGHSMSALSLAANTDISAADMASWINNSIATSAGAVSPTEINVTAAELDFDKLITINGTVIAHGNPAPNTASELATLINAQTGVTNVTATATALGGLKLTNATGHHGKPIELANPDKSSTTNGLGLANKIFTSIGVTAVASNVIHSKASDLNYSRQISINGVTVDGNYQADASASGLASLINAKTKNQYQIAFVDSDASGACSGQDLTFSFNGKTATVDLYDETNSRARYTGRNDANLLTEVNAQLQAQGIDFTASLTSSSSSGFVFIQNTAALGSAAPTSTLDGSTHAVTQSLVGTNVVASANADGGISLMNLKGAEGRNIELGNPDNTSSSNALGQSNRIYTGILNISSDDKVRFTFGSNGQPADLAEIGLETGLYIKETVGEDLAVFLTGEGAASISTAFTEQDMEPSKELQKDSPFVVSFISDTQYTITDTRSETLVAKREFILGEPIKYQNFTLMLDAKPSTGDTFAIEENIDGVGNNGNILLMVDLQNKPVVGGYQSIGDAYIDIVGTVGNKATLSRISKEALEVVYEQAVEAKDSVSGVSLDSEAADLIRFQQAYQASAQVLQTANKLFDTVLGLG